MLDKLHIWRTVCGVTGFYFWEQIRGLALFADNLCLSVYHIGSNNLNRAQVTFVPIQLQTIRTSNWIARVDTELQSTRASCSRRKIMNLWLKNNSLIRIFKTFQSNLQTNNFAFNVHLAGQRLYLLWTSLCASSDFKRRNIWQYFVGNSYHSDSGIPNQLRWPSLNGVDRENQRYVDQFHLSESCLSPLFIFPC